jgi:hypothetical protein
VTNAQPAGIGRVAVIGELAAWNNLGRNVVFADHDLRPCAVFGDTVFPHDDELSEYDLDIHAILREPASGLAVVLNHLGLLRAFGIAELTSSQGRYVHPRWARQFEDDVERAVMMSSRVIGSRPRWAGARGIVVSEPLGPTPRTEPLSNRRELETWGEVTALASMTYQGAPALAVGGPGHVGLAPMTDGRVGQAGWEVEVPFRTAALVHHGRLLWAAGSTLVEGIGDYEWEKVRGGGIVALHPPDGRVLVSGPLPDAVAWGNGGSSLVVFAGVPCVIGRSGLLYVGRPDPVPEAGRRNGGDSHARPNGITWTQMDVDGQTDDQGDRPSGSGPSPESGPSLGIGHAAAVDRRILYGFNRGGYRLRAVVGDAVTTLAGSPGR